MDKVPIVSEDSYVAPNASLIGDVLVNDKVTIWYGSVIRADVNKIEIGAYSTIYDNSTLTVGDILPTGFPANLRVAEYSVIGHGCFLRSCEIKSHVMVGAGSTVLEGCIVESFARIEPGTVVPPGRVIPAGQVWGGSPARYIRNTTDEEKEDVVTAVRKNYDLGMTHKEEFYLHRSLLHHQANAARREVNLAITE
jgi:carbonic anhydrase/acetyltransferase-like protein (isoleucine patch superfamily)